MQLIIAEKPSVAKAIATALSIHPQTEQGFIDLGTVDNKPTIISWAAGHLVDLDQPAAYKPEWKKWNWDELPIDPHGNWKWTVPTNAKARYSVLVKLMKQSDIIINACDPDREGEGIFTRIIQHSHQENKTLLRLWANSIDVDGIRAAWENLQPASMTRGLAAASDARAKADWMTGLTASRAYSLLYNRKCAIGRVETPLLAMIVERDQQIANHKPTPFYRVHIPMDGFTLVSQKLDTKQQAEELLAAIPDQVMVTVERKQMEQKPPLLHSLTSVQREANQQAGLTASETLAALQSTYEKGLTTYPRTDSQYITTDDVASLTLLLEDSFLQSSQFTTQMSGEHKAEQVANNRKVEGHTALLPTNKLTADAYATLSEREKTVVQLVVRRMWEATGTPRIHTQTKVCCTINNVEFSATGDTTIDPGWTVHEPSSASEKGKENHIPESVEDHATYAPIGALNFTEGLTQPPKPYTDSTLLAEMEHAGKRVEDQQLRTAINDDTNHSGGIGTPATRASMIEKTIKNGYAQRKGKHIISTTEGQQLINVLAPGLTNVEATARMEQGLTQIMNNQLDENDWLTLISQQVAGIPSAAQAHYQESFKKGNTMQNQQSYGSCPQCGQPVIKTGSIWQCSTNKNTKTESGQWTTSGCGFKLFPTIAGHKLTDKQVSDLLANKGVKAADLTSKAGKKFTATLKLSPETHRIIFDFGK